jgi:hypothetical protein
MWVGGGEKGKNERMTGLDLETGVEARLGDHCGESNIKAVKFGLFLNRGRPNDLTPVIRTKLAAPQIVYFRSASHSMATHLKLDYKFKSALRLSHLNETAKNLEKW